MRQLKAEILSNKKVGSGFYRMKLGENYLAKITRAGQFVEVRCSSGAETLLRRPLGVHRIWPDGIEMLYEVVGKGTALLSEKKAGEKLDMIGPLGNGFDTDLASDINILVAGGIGVAPLTALAENLRARQNKKVHVMIGARTRSHIMCKEEFKSLGCSVKISTDDGSRGYKGFATELLINLLATCKPETYLPQFRRVMVYACGPMEMLRAVRAITLKRGIPCQVSLEERMACGVGVCLGCPVKMKTGGYKMVCKDGPVFNTEDLAW
ncbi:MAG: dihydroorotate dehydrogenase electron transfer subunit [Candidatus Omnitrophica bacterium]|nr:dihydroorotate dehydrogenase electron transfer subunit [Candidatus Omnitrophota bacterium]